jgi:short-subunit dehydrogenase
MRRGARFHERYGLWAIVAGASEGLGAAFTRELARRGVNVLIVARREGPLQELAERVRAEFGVDVDVVALDLAADDAIDRLAAATADREVGLVIANAALVPVGRFLDVSSTQLDTAVDVNARAPMRLARRFLPAMVERRRGGFVVMSSMAGLQGSSGLVGYSSTKAFGLVLAEGLWYEMKPHGVDVIGCAAGAIAGEKLDGVGAKQAPGTLSPERVAGDTLNALGRGPRVIPGRTNRLGAFVFGRLLTRGAAVRAMAKASGSLQSHQ